MSLLIAGGESFSAMESALLEIFRSVPVAAGQ